MNDVIRRKLANTVLAGSEGGPGADHGWRLAFSRAARDTAGLQVDVQAQSTHRRTLAELLELPPERALLALLDGPKGGLGIMIISAEVMSALVESQTTGRVSATVPMSRRPTRTDAAMISITIDHALEELEAILSDEADLVWAGGFRYASFLEDPRPLGLLMEDQPYRVLCADLGLGGGVRTGRLILALPADGRGDQPTGLASANQVPMAAGNGFAAELGQTLEIASSTLNAIIARLTLPLQDVMDLQPDQILALPQASMDQISVEGIDGTPAGSALLGQLKGMRAVRLHAGLPLTLSIPQNDPAESGPHQEQRLAFPSPETAIPAPFGGPLDLDGTGLLAAG